jgi:hypothetical protein
VTGGCILEPGDKIEVMWRDKEKEKEYSEPFGWFDATVLDIKDFSQLVYYLNSFHFNHAKPGTLTIKRCCK